MHTSGGGNEREMNICLIIINASQRQQFKTRPHGHMLCDVREREHEMENFV